MHPDLRTMKHLGPNELEMAMIEEFGINIVHGPWEIPWHFWRTYAGFTVMLQTALPLWKWQI